MTRCQIFGCLQMSMAELWNHHAGYLWMDLHPHTSDKSVLTFSLKLSCSHALETHTNTHNSKPLPSFLLTASRLCSRHTPIVITSGLNYKLLLFFSPFTLLRGGKQFPNFIQRATEEKKKWDQEKVGGWNKSSAGIRWGLLRRKKKSFLVSLYRWSHKSANTDAHTHTCTQRLR